MWLLVASIATRFRGLFARGWVIAQIIAEPNTPPFDETDVKKPGRFCSSCDWLSLTSVTPVPVVCSFQTITFPAPLLTIRELPSAPTKYDSPQKHEPMGNTPTCSVGLVARPGPKALRFRRYMLPSLPAAVARDGMGNGCCGMTRTPPAPKS